MAERDQGERHKERAASQQLLNRADRKIEAIDRRLESLNKATKLYLERLQGIRHEPQ